MDFLDDLGRLGLEHLEGVELYGDPNEKKEEKASPKVATETKMDEADMLFKKSCTCVVCDRQFKTLTVRSGKARLVESDRDLRPKYEDIEPLKYEVISCPYCGFSAVSRFFVPMASSQKKNVVEKICSKVKPLDANKDTYTYEEAMDRYKLALVNSVVKISKASEKAYTCLKTGWLVRSYIETLENEEKPDREKIEKLLDEEERNLKNAYDGFLHAIAEESFPICGMDEQTVNYLLAVLALRFGDFAVSRKLTASILTSKNASARLKDKALEIKEELLHAT